MMCPASLRNAVEVLPEVEVEDFTDRRLCQHTGKILKAKVPQECQVQKEMALKTLSLSRYGRREHEKWLLEYSGYSGYSASPGQEKQCY